MSVNLASLIAPQFSWSVFGVPVEIPVGSASGLVSALRAPPGTELTLVSVKCIRADDVCVPISTLVVLPGAGDSLMAADKCCCPEAGMKVWHVLPDTILPFLHVSKGSLTQLVKAKKSAAKIFGASLTFGNVQLNGSVISFQMNAYWSESISGVEVVLVDQSFDFSFDFGVQNPYSIHLLDIDGPFGIPVSVDANISVTLSPNQVCAELRASWPGGNVQGPHGCQGF